MSEMSEQENKSSQNVRRLIVSDGRKASEVFFHKDIEEDEFNKLSVSLAKEFRCVVVCGRV